MQTAPGTYDTYGGSECFRITSDKRVNCCDLHSLKGIDLLGQAAEEAASSDDLRERLGRVVDLANAETRMVADTTNPDKPRPPRGGPGH